STESDAVYTGKRETKADYDFRAFFIMGDRERMFRRIDSRCEAMLERGLLVETADLLVKGTLDPASPAGRAIGYRQAIDFLTQDVDVQTVGIAEGGLHVRDVDAESRFLEFYHGFAAKTRQYASDQMKWFRSSKGRLFSWQAWDLGGHVEGPPWLDVAASIAEDFKLSPEAFAETLAAEHQASLRKENETRGKDMKRYVPTVRDTSLGDTAVLRRLVVQAKDLARRVEEAQH
ncbi:unnamed protein product, partial [Sphacelaria rigidula]